MKSSLAIAVALMLPLLGCEKQRGTPGAGEVVVYRDPAHGFSIKYPKEWKMFEINGRVVFAESQEVIDGFLHPQSGKPDAQVSVEVIRSDGKALEQIVREAKTELMNSNYILDANGRRKDEAYNGSGRQGVMVAYLIKPSPLKNIFGHQVFFAGNGLVYRLDFRGLDQEYGLHVPVFEAMLKSLTFDAYFGFTASSSPSEPSGSRSLVVESDISFLNVPLVCNVAPRIGCGSRAKFLMLDLMKDSTVNGAWLNRRGTFMAVVWNGGTNMSSRQRVLDLVFSQHELPIEQVSEPDRRALLEDFKARDNWYQGSDVDALSIEEAGVIADRILTVVSRHARFKTYEETRAFREEVKTAVQRRFLAITSANDLNAVDRGMEREVMSVAEKYLGKGNMPDPTTLRQEYNALRAEDERCSDECKEKGASCGSQKSG